MKAIIARSFGPLNQLDYADMPEPVPGGADVVIEAEAIGVNYPDALLVQGLYQSRPQTPFVPGMEVVGRVTAIGPDVTALKVGDRVCAMPGIGAYAQKVLAPQATAMTLPDGMDAGHACALLCGYGTAHHALRQRGALQAGETLCVLGAAGATGLAAVQIGKAIGAKVIAVASTPEKQAVARDAGADVVLGYDGLKDKLKDATGGAGVDVAFDPVGGEAFDALSRAMAWNGRLLVVGFASGAIPQFPVNLALVKGYAVVGVFWGAFVQKQPGVYARNVAELLAWYASEAVRPVIEGTYPLSDAAAVLARLMAREAFGKLILKPDPIA